MSMPGRIGRFRIVGKLGAGGMGVVYAAHDLELDRPVAIKMIKGQEDETARRRFRREAKAAARVRHPNVCQLYDIGEEAGELYLALELLEGESLAARLEHGPLAVPEAIQLSLDVLSALGALHEQGIVHRDLKPSNIFVTSHGAKLLDFGLARDTAVYLGTEEDTRSKITRAGALVGTPHYMSPEQLRGEAVDERSDIFSAGVLLFEMVAGRRPFLGNTPVEIFHATLYEPPPALGGSPQAAVLDRVARRALAKTRSERFQTAFEMREALRQALGMADSGESPRPRAMRRLIVLPFRILRTDPDTDFLALSVPDAIATSLAGVESLIVRSSAAAARFAQDVPDLPRIAREAEVDLVLTGTLIRAGTEIRVSTQLASAPDGTLLWSAKSQSTMRDVFQLQDDLVTRIVESLSLTLTARETRMLKKDVPASASAYELYLRGNQIVLRGLRGGEDLRVAHDLYQRCVEEDPGYAPAWAKLGRCCWLIGKGMEHGGEMLAHAGACFEKALSLNPDLDLAHNLYAQVQPDLGKAKDAMTRLLARLKRRSTEPELFAALLHACRYCGLLEASVAAYERAVALDPLISTSVNQTFYQLGEPSRAKHVMGKGTFYLDALILVEENKLEEAVRLLRERERGNLPPVTQAFVTSLRAAADGARAESVEATRRALRHFPDPEGMYYLCRQLAYCGEVEDAIGRLEEVLDRGFILYRVLVRQDPWLDSLRTLPRFQALVERSREAYAGARAAFLDAEGDRLLGSTTPSAG